MARNKSSDDVDQLRAQLAIALAPKRPGVEAQLRRRLTRLITDLPKEQQEVFVVFLQLIGDLNGT